MIIFCSIILGLGIYLIIAELLKLPKLKMSFAVSRVMKLSTKSFSFDQLMSSYALKIAPYIKMSTYKKQRLKTKLDAADISKTPEEYLATAIAKSGLLVLISIVCVLIFPIFSPIILVASIIVFGSEYKKAFDIAEKKREQIESQMPRLAATIAQELHSTRDIKKILTGYKKNANPFLQKEISITLADMNSGNDETALLRFASRTGSPMLTEVIRGLIAVIRGDNGIVFFEMLARDFKKIELQKLKIIAIKRPSKMNKYSFLMLACLILTYLVVLGYQIFNSFGKML